MRVSIGQRELEHFDDGVGALDGGRVEAVVGHRLQEAQRLQQRRTLRPRPRLRDRAAAEGRRDRRLVRGGEGVDVRIGEDGGVIGPGGVPMGVREEGDGGVQDPLPARAGGVDASSPIAPCLRGRVDEVLQDVGVSGVAHEVAAAGRGAFRHPQRSGGRPVRTEEIGHPSDGRRRCREERVPLACVGDRGAQHVVEVEGAVVAQKQEPRVDGERNGGREATRAGHELEALRAEVRDRRTAGSGALTHEDRRSGRAGSLEDSDQIPAGSVEVRLHDVQHEPARHDRVERVPAAFEHRLCCTGGEPVRRSGEAVDALQLRARRRRRRRGVGHAVSRAIQASTSSAVRGMPAERFSGPSAVMRMSSSMRTPIPRNSSGTVRSSIWK